MDALSVATCTNAAHQCSTVTTKSPAEELGLLDPAVSDATLLDAMLEHPVLVNRPIVCSPKGVALCRPSEKVLPLLKNPPAEFTKEDGQRIS